MTKITNSDTYEQKVFKSSVSGKIVSAEYARENPASTYADTITMPRIHHRHELQQKGLQVDSTQGMSVDRDEAELLD